MLGSRRKSQAIQGNIVHRSSTVTRVALVPLSLWVLLTADVANAAAPVTNLYLSIVRDGEFEVILSRSKGVDASVLFGWVGITLMMDSRHARDTEREALVAPGAEATVCRSGFERALRNRLEEKNFFVAIEPNRQLPVLKVKIVACGFRVLNRSTKEMSAFFDATYRLRQAGTRQSPRAQRLFVAGNVLAAWSEFEQSPALAADEFQQVQMRAGQTLANKIIFAGGN
ncbi:MAG: hypothetical protein OXP09_03540 [Gammaproteobacteria bacterium]|nr:hypothetical protein [Rhodospirillaceae bacterium]MDE0364625.1 hypothetical protein [Gammaproteobacteria bacterium]